MEDQPRTGRRARAILIAQAAVLGALVLLTAFASRAEPPAAGAGPPRGADGAAARADVRPATPADGARRSEPEPSLARTAPPAPVFPAAPEDEGEGEHYARYRALLAQDPGALERAAPGLLLGDAPLAQRVGLLRAMDEGGSPAATGLLRLALTSGPPAARSGDVQDFALRCLARRAGEDPAARAALRAAVWGREASPDPALRRRAAGHLAATASAAELAAGFPELAAEQDPLVAQAVTAALAQRR